MRITLSDLVREATRVLPTLPNKATAYTTHTQGQVIGNDDGRLFFVSSSGPSLYESADDGVSFTSNRTLPAGLTSWDYARKVVAFEGSLYLMGVSSSLITVWRTSPNYAAPAATYTWTQVHQCSTGANNAIGPTFSTDGDYLYLGEYGDPTGGPSIWRSPDGTTWSNVEGPLASNRHIHAVTPDPFNPGHVWATLGDGGTKLVMRSTDYGETWETIVGNELGTWPQAVQLSFSEEYVWFAADQIDVSVWVMDRTEQVPRIASSNYHGDYPVPGAVDRPGGSRFTDGVFTAASKTMTSATATFVAGDVGRIVSSNRLPSKNVYIASVQSGTSVTLSDNAVLSGTSQAFFLGGQRFADVLMAGLVDPDTGIYYGHAHSATNNEDAWQAGVFVMHGPGRRLELYSRLQAINGVPPYEMFLTDDYVWVGRWRVPRITT